MRNVWLLFKKEILAALRDRRTAILVLVFPLIFYPAMLGLIFHFTSQNVSDGRATVSQVIYQNREASQVLANFFERDEEIVTSFYEDKGEASRAFEEGSGDVLLLVEEKEQSGVDVDISYRKFDQGSEIALSRTKRVLENYLQKTLEQKLEGMGVSYDEITPPMEIQVNEVGSAATAIGEEVLKMMLPYFVILSIITAAMGLGAEITAGEKEKRTISTLLVSRLSREEIVLGKFMTVFIVAAIAAVFSVVGLVYGLGLFGIALPLSNLTPAVFGYILLTMLPLVAILSALVISIGSFARTQKEANVYQTPVLMLVVLTGILSMTGGIELGNFAYFIPLLNSLETFKELIVGTTNLFHIGATFLTTVPLAGLLVFLAIGLFKREDILFRV
ncbi:MAG: ABC transporter permease [Candidatus Bipolaricaulota bacterium]|nr:ABC transporter permease [Candidatus Bipolaricaulota bacterium]MBS3791805.1 ABC transporter permease [Candidatus Bipolaricaulota bacterium]